MQEPGCEAKRPRLMDNRIEDERLEPAPVPKKAVFLLGAKRTGGPDAS